MHPRSAGTGVGDARLWGCVSRDQVKLSGAASGGALVRVRSPDAAALRPGGPRRRRVHARLRTTKRHVNINVIEVSPHQAAPAAGDVVGGGVLDRGVGTLGCGSSAIREAMRFARVVVLLAGLGVDAGCDGQCLLYATRRRVFWRGGDLGALMRHGPTTPRGQRSVHQLSAEGGRRTRHRSNRRRARWWPLCIRPECSPR